METFSLIVFGAVLIILGGSLLGSSEYEASGSWLVGAGIVAFIVCLILLAIAHQRYIWIGDSSFGIEMGRWSKGVSREARIDSFEGLFVRGGITEIKLSGGTTIPVPPGLEIHVNTLNAILRERNPALNARDEASLSEPLPMPSPWPPRFTFEYNEGSPVDVSRIEIDDPGALHSLLRHYRATAIYRDSFPPAFDLVKILVGLKRWNGGLLLIGVDSRADLVGLTEEEFQAAKSRMMRVASELTDARVEIGRIELQDKIALFAVFNATAELVRPLESLKAATSDVSVV